jgi:hypothetical protein
VKSVRPDICTVQEGVPAEIVKLQLVYMGNVDSPCLDPGRRGTVILRDGRASVSGSRRDGLRASLGITIAQSWYANRQFVPVQISAQLTQVLALETDPAARANLVRCSSYQGMSVHMPDYSGHRTHQVSPASDLYV